MFLNFQDTSSLNTIMQYSKHVNVVTTTSNLHVDNKEYVEPLTSHENA